MTTQTRISIVTPSLNQGRFIREAIESVLAQQDPNFEHIIVDGNSTDETLDVLAEYPHLKVYRGPDRSQADALNKGYAQATGLVFGELNADDYFLPGCFAAVRKHMQSPEPAEAITGGCDFVRDGQVVYRCRPQRAAFDDLQRWFRHGIAHPSTFFTRDVFHRSGGYNPEIRYAPDVDLWLRMTQVATFKTIPEVLSVNRCHDAACQCREYDANAIACLYHIARYGSMDAFGEMLRFVGTTIGRGPASETINQLATSYACMVWALLGRWNAGTPARVAIYGAGTHTQWLLRATADVAGPDVVAILTDELPHRPHNGSAPVLQPQQLDADRVDLVLISSDSYEEQIAVRAREHFGDRLPVLRLYEFVAGLPLPKEIFTQLGHAPSWLVERSAHASPNETTPLAREV
jgi:hypothetical protein